MTEPSLIVCLDVDYRLSMAVAAGVWFRGWSAQASEFETTAVSDDVAEYQPGEFYRRELPCLLGVLRGAPPADLVIVDGYVSLGERRAGLGMHLYEAMDKNTPVVGIAKTNFRLATEAIQVFRGVSTSPLFVTAVGIDANEAAQQVVRMHGPYRIPAMLKRVDQLARGTEAVIP